LSHGGRATVLASQAKTNAIQLVLQAILLKLEVNTEKIREEPKANFAFAKQSKASSSGMGQARVKPTSPSYFNGDQKKGRAFLNTFHIHFSVCGDLFKGDQVCVSNLGLWD